MTIVDDSIDRLSQLGRGKRVLDFRPGCWEQLEYASGNKILKTNGIRFHAQKTPKMLE
ncbi:hypothetical protein BN2497_5521 [Janthinobacterium sp. CG23_2]|nr:hypothetical protein BN2497_5521 [Janthinobacterium sp. CG23_2]CUU29158.1 hypothetical protein BN3177_5521 [Janthinobacterium sp. CG23_2]